MTPPTSFGVPNALNTLEHHPNTLKHYQNALKVFYYWCFRCFRSQVYKALLRQWHPDKNLDDGNVATRVFQYLQEKKDWLMAD